MASFTPDVAGAYTFQLTVNNGTLSSSSNVTITATGGTVTNPGSASLPPVAIAGKNRNVATGKYFLLDGSASPTLALTR
jgi:PKD repeat protein